MYNIDILINYFNLMNFVHNSAPRNSDWKLLISNRGGFLLFFSNKSSDAGSV